MTATVIHRIADAKLAKKWSDKDVLGFLQQLGVIPARKRRTSREPPGRHREPWRLDS